MRKRKKRTKRNIIEDDFGGTPPREIHDIDYMRVVEFMPALPNAKNEVHMLIYLKSDPDCPLTMRFKSPDTLGDWISVLARYRKKVFPDADPLEVFDDAHDAT